MNKLHRALLATAEEARKMDADLGICCMFMVAAETICSEGQENADAIQGAAWELHAEMKDLMNKWPKHSGSNIYPVPHPHMSSGAAFYDSSPEDMWDPDSGEYARNRWELLNWMIEESKNGDY